MIIYIHGFGTSGQSGKGTLFRNYFKSKNIRFIAPSLSYVPELAVSTLEELIESYDEEVTLIGSSLGGYYSMYLSQKYGCKAVLVNPVIKASEVLTIVLGDTKNYYDNSRFTWSESHLEMLKQYETSTITNENYLLMLQKADHILDYSKALEKLPEVETILEDGGTHAFENIERHLEKMINHLNYK